MTIKLGEKILTNEYFYDIKSLFDELLTLENDVYNLLNNQETSSIFDENNPEYQMLGIDESMSGFGNSGYDNYDEVINRADLSNLLSQYDIVLNKVFIVFSNGIDQLKDKKLNSIKKFYSINVDKLFLDNIDNYDKENLELFMDNPYGLLYNSFVYYFEIFMNYFVNYDNAKDDVYYKSDIVGTGLPINFGDLENLKKWEDSIDIKDFTVQNFISNSEGNITNISVKHLLALGNSEYTLKGLLK